MTLKKISILTGGSRGDIQPYIAIGCALRDAGYDVRILTNINHASFVTNFDLIHSHIYADFDKISKSDPIILKATADGDTQSFFGAFLKVVTDHGSEDCRLFLKEMKEHRPDLLLIASFGRYLGHYASRIMNIPSMEVLLQTVSWSLTRSPWGLPAMPEEAKQREFALSLLGGTYELWKPLDGEMVKLDGGRALLPSFSKEEFLANQTSPAFPRLVCQSPSFREILYPEAHENVHLVGSCVIDRERQKSHMSDFGGNETREQIETFLTCKPNDKPVYCGWGSMIFKSPEKMVEFAVRALQVSGRRGIVLKGWAGLCLETLESSSDDADLINYARENVLFVSEASHEDLFSRVSCTVHHGGAGTLNAALRSGVPTIVTPVFMDQYDHAHLVTELGVGVGFTKQLQKITGEELGEVISGVVSNLDMASKAKEIGIKMRDEDGTNIVLAEVNTFWNDYVLRGKVRQLAGGQ